MFGDELIEIPLAVGRAAQPNVRISYFEPID
jgi:hypothetical protein